MLRTQLPTQRRVGTQRCFKEETTVRAATNALLKAAAESVHVLVLLVLLVGTVMGPVQGR